jgi:xanthine dehydrogenase accessory factor
VFTGNRVAAMEDQVRETVGGYLDAVVEHGACDLVADISGPFPLDVISAVLGIPAADRPDLRGMADQLLVREDGSIAGEGPAALTALAADAIRTGRGHVLEHDGVRVFADVYGPPPRLLVYGAVDTAEALCRAAGLLGGSTIVADARARFATPERLPSAGEIVVAWPEETIARVEPDAGTAIVVLTHDDKFDEPALKRALETEAFYVGALGSRRNQERRRERLLEAGVAEEALDRRMGPCGLDIGADTQEETELSMLAEVVAVRGERDGGFLKHAKKRIHVEVQ